MDGHNSWLKKGFDQGYFLLAGSLTPNQGGGLLAYNLSKEELLDFINQDPFVSNNVVFPEVIEIDPAKTDSKLSFLLN